jgi:NlpC/P60 family putative phage cell wall peptidase
MIISRTRIVAIARAWIDTPYRHQASERGVGADCLGLVRGVWRELYGAEPEPVPPYSPDWAEADGAETLRDAARRRLREVALDAAREGDVLLFRIRTDAPAKHAAILVPGGRIVHAYWGRAVAETALTPWWARRAACAFAFPNVAD